MFGDQTTIIIVMENINEWCSEKRKTEKAYEKATEKVKRKKYCQGITLTWRSESGRITKRTLVTVW